MLRVVGMLLALWVALIVLGAIVKAVLWLAVAGLVVLVLTVGWSWAQQQRPRR